MKITQATTFAAELTRQDILNLRVALITVIGSSRNDPKWAVTIEQLEDLYNELGRALGVEE